MRKLVLTALLALLVAIPSSSVLASVIAPLAELPILPAAEGDIGNLVIDSGAYVGAGASSIRICHAIGDIYAIVSNHGTKHLVTVDVASDGTLGTERDSIDEGLEYPTILKIANGIVAVVSRDGANDGWIDTYSIAADGTISAAIDSLEYDPLQGGAPDMVHVSGDVYAIAYSGNGNDGWVCTLTIDSSGNIGAAVIDTLEFDAVSGGGPRIVHMSGDIYAIAYYGPDTDGWLCTVDIDSSGNIGAAVIDTLEFDASYALYVDMIEIADNMVAIVYMDISDDGWLKTVGIDGSGNIDAAPTATLEFDAATGMLPSIHHISGDVYVISYSAPGVDGWLRTYPITSAGAIGAQIDFKEYATNVVRWSDIQYMAGTQIYVIAYTETSNNAGRMATITIETVTGPSAPTVTTSAATNVEETSATLNGNITATGGENATTRGFEYDTDSGSPYANDWHEDGSFGVGAFTHGLTSLTEGELYYYRAYATNSAGTSYGSEVKFLTKPVEPDTFAATATGDGVITLTWNKGTGAQKTYIRGEAGSYPTDRTDGYLVYNNTGVTTTDTGLTGGTTYYYRAWSYATEGGEEQYSDSYDQDNAMAIEAPVMTTNAATDILSTTATLNGSVDDLKGASSVTERGFVWDTTSRGDPGDTAPGSSAYVDNWTESGSFSTGAFSHGATSLVPVTTYYFRAAATNGTAWAYGSELTFDTIMGPPTNFVATYVSDYQVDLTWTKGAGATNTEIRAKYNSYPTDETDGRQVYFSTGTSVSDTGVDLDMRDSSVYYRAWSEDGASGYSTEYAEASVGGTAMLTLALVVAVLGLTGIAFWRKDAPWFMAGTMGWLVLSIVLINETWSATNAFIPYAVGVVGLSVTLLMAVQVIRTFNLGRERLTPRERSKQVQTEHREKVEKLTRKKPRQPWWDM